MAGANETKRAARAVQDPEHRGNKNVRRQVFEEHAIEASEHRSGVPRAESSRLVPHQLPGHLCDRTDQRTVSGDIPDEDSEVVGVEGEKIVEIAALLPGGTSARRNANNRGSCPGTEDGQ